MKNLVVFLTFVTVAFSAPTVTTDYYNYDKITGTENDADIDLDLKRNTTFTVDTRRPVGFGGWGSGTVGGEGGSVFTVWDAFALRNALNSNERRVIYVRGRIDLTTMFSGGAIYLPVGSYTTLQGGDRNAEIFGGGLHIFDKRQIIIRNLRITNSLSYAPGEQPDGNGGIINLSPGDFSSIDAVGIGPRTEFVWVDHCEFSDDPWIASQGPRRHDGLIDIIRASDWITISNNIFRNHNLVSLVGNSPTQEVDRGRLRVTFYANWFRGTIQRNPYVRFGSVHLLNNLYTDIQDYGIGAGHEASLFVERNVFVDCRDRRGAISSTNNDRRGAIYDLRNAFRNCSFDTNIPNNVHWTPFDFYSYRALPIGDVENHVRRYAGVP